MSEIITSPRNRRVVRARKLGQRKYRQQEHCFLVDGLQALHMGLAAGFEPVELFYCEELFAGQGAPGLLQRCRQTRAELVSVSVPVMATLSERDRPQGLVGVFPFVDRPLEEVRLTGSELVLVLDRLQNPGNLGTLLRTADAVGSGGVMLLEPCVDLFDPTAVRGSMGSLFNVPVVRVGESEELFARLKERGLRVIGADPYEGELWHRGRWEGGVALVLGNEAKGLSEEVRPHVETWVRLPMTGGVESLNVAVVGGVLMYEWMRENEE